MITDPCMLQVRLLGQQQLKPSSTLRPAQPPGSQWPQQLGNMFLQLLSQLAEFQLLYVSVGRLPRLCSIRARPHGGDEAQGDQERPSGYACLHRLHNGSTGV